ncbi:MAG: M48 family metallopeptidase [Synechococcaceae cyanobacterium]|nr:M48 family metallopeptidase [Synechococcaceae cyanobacterium]
MSAASDSSNVLKHAFKARVRHWTQRLELPLAAIAIRPMRRKWASCSSRGQLSFSHDLLPLNLELWDYVIVHELLHLQIPNHGRLWKLLMRAHLGDWEHCEQRLRQALALAQAPPSLGVSSWPPGSAASSPAERLERCG